MKRKNLEAGDESEYFKVDYSGVMDEVEKKFGLAVQILDPTHRNGSYISTGNLTTDLIFGIGIVPGAFYVISGGEGSGKTTQTTGIVANGLYSSIPMMGFVDAENSFDPVYAESIIKNMYSSNTSDVDLTNLFGVRNPKNGKWLKQPKCRYYPDNQLETVLDALAGAIKRLPDKLCLEGKWFYVFPRTKENISALKGKYDKNLSSQYNKFYVPAPNGDMQALFVIDSLPAMLPEDSDDEERGTGIGLAARKFSEYLPKLVGKLRRKHASLVAINQLRERPMCLHYDSRVLLAGGSSVKIGDIVTKKLNVTVRSYNFNTRKFENKPVTGHFNNGIAKDMGQFFKLTFSTGKANGKSVVVATKEHTLFKPDGSDVSVENLRVGDDVLYYESNYPNSDAWQVIYGSMLGDGSLTNVTKGAGAETHRLKIVHGTEQATYCKHKGMVLGSTRSDVKHSNGYYETSTVIRGETIAKLHREAYTYNNGELQRKFSNKLAQRIDLRGIAIWYQDDGHIAKDYYKHLNISVAQYTDTDVKKFARMLTDKTGISWKYSISVRNSPGTATHGKWDKYVYLDNRTDIKTFLQLISPYLHKDMLYKLGKFKVRNASSYTWSNTTVEKACVAKLIAKEKSEQTTKNFWGKKKCLYDIEVADNHNYIVDGVLVHNSMGNPWYEPCGNAVKFYSSVRLQQTSRAVPHASGQFEEEPSVTVEGGEDKYRYINLKNIKNKTSTPYLEGWARVWVSDANGVGRGFCPAYDLLSFLRMTGQIDAHEKTKLTSIKKATLSFPPLADQGITKIDWLDLKGLVLLKGDELRELCKSLGLKKNPKLREYAQQQILSGKALELMFAQRGEVDEDEDDDIDNGDD